MQRRIGDAWSMYRPTRQQTKVGRVRKTSLDESEDRCHARLMPSLVLGESDNDESDDENEQSRGHFRHCSIARSSPSVKGFVELSSQLLFSRTAKCDGIGTP